MAKNNDIKYDYEKEISFSIDEIKNIAQETAYKVNLPGFPIHDCIALSQKDENEGFIIKFIVDDVFDASYMREFDKFGIKEKIFLERSGNRYAVNKNSTERVTVTISTPKVISIKVSNFQTSENKFFDDRLLRLVIPTEIEIELGVFQCKSLHISGTTYFCGLLEVTLNKKTYHLYKHRNDDTKENFLIIDSLEENLFEEFKRNTSAIIMAFGFVTGNLFRDEYYYQTLKKDGDLTLIDDTAYYKNKSSVITHANLFNPMDFRDYLKYYEKENLLKVIPSRLDLKIFSNICELISSNVTLSRSINLLIEGHQTKLLLLKAGIYSISLETITSFIADENEEKIKPIAEKKLAKKIRTKFKEIIDEYEPFMTDYGVAVLNSKIDNINSPTNSKKLSKPFEIYNLKLSDLEMKILGHRNKFLHGTSPFEESELSEKDSDIAFISKKLLTLCNMLILKYCGYRGHLIDYSGYHQLDFEEEMTEHLFKIL